MPVTLKTWCSEPNKNASEASKRKCEEVGREAFGAAEARNPEPWPCRQAICPPNPSIYCCQEARCEASGAADEDADSKQWSAKEKAAFNSVQLEL